MHRSWSEGRKSRIRVPLSPLKYASPPVVPARRQLLSQKKSKKAAYILILGQGESGKSTTLNMLFGGREITPVERETGTQQVLEFSASLNSGEIHVIDTPGLGDMNGLEWDAQILATIENFRKNHKDLQPCIPNIVIIVARFDDNRIAGDLSSFVKMLKSINYQRSKFLDSKFNNLIIILTHFMNGSKTLRMNPQPRIELVKSLVKTYTNFVHEPNVILAENEANDWELKVDESCCTSSSSYLLTNGDSYPQNLIDTISLICKDSSDKIGEEIFQEAFNQRNQLNLQQLEETASSVVDISNEIAQMTMAKLTNIYFTARSSEMFSQLNDKWIQMSRSTTESCFEALLVNLEKHRYRDFDQLPKDQEIINEFLIQLQPNFDETLFKLLGKLFNWQPSNLVKIMKNNVGFGYNIGYDGMAEVQPFEFYNSSYQINPTIIYRLPKDIKCEPIVNEIEKEKIVFYIFASREEYWNNRMKDFHLQQSGQKIVTEGKLKVGYNIIRKQEQTTTTRSTAQSQPKPLPRKRSLGRRSSSKTKAPLPPAEEAQDFLTIPKETLKTFPISETITIAKEYRIGKLKLAQDYNSLPLEPNFLSNVIKLSTFNPKIRSSMNSWRAFLHKFGTHVIKSAFVGGVIEITVNKHKLIERIKRLHGKELNTSNLTTYENDLKQELITLFDFETDNHNQFEQDLIIKLETKGGNKLLSNVDNLFQLRPTEKLQLFNNWKDSIRINPSLLDRNIQLIPIKILVEKIITQTNETKPLLDSFDLALETLYYTIPKKDNSSLKMCQFL